VAPGNFPRAFLFPEIDRNHVKFARYIAAPVIVVVVWLLASHAFGERLVPPPGRVVVELTDMAGTAQLWRHLSLTVFRGTAGLALATLMAIVIGVPCGLLPRVMHALSPLVTAVQVCPPIIWISLLLVWVGLGTAVPILVVVVAVFPVLFLSIAHAVMSLNRELFEMASIYHVPPKRVLTGIIIPGVAQHALGAFSFALGITWKVTATAEFFGAESGVGARLYWAYRNLDMSRLFAWAIVLVIIGMALEMGLIHPLRDSLQPASAEPSDA
jgi:NitT/TauT family transport system permease protein